VSTIAAVVLAGRRPLRTRAIAPLLQTLGVAVQLAVDVARNDAMRLTADLERWRRDPPSGESLRVLP